ncbi:MAG: ACP S-malonyltransferase [Spirochaetia bacterium]|nr:ACP S-malonyltransferase [Spirochaetia bacterium]
MSITGKVAIVFPGQGSQKQGMAQDFYDQSDIAKKTFEEASSAIGEDLTHICFEEDPRLDLTEFTQPAILTAEIAMYRYLQNQYSFNPSFFAGHSLGEYTALVAAGVIPFEDAVKIVRKRGALMQAAVPPDVGAMAAVILPDIESTNVKNIVDKNGAELANLNSLEQYVISGKKESVQKAAAELEKEHESSGINIVFLTVSAPFHSSLMKEIEPEFKEFLMSFVGFNMDRVSSVLSNFTADFHTAEKLIDNLVSQISGSVQWIENMRLLGKNAETVIELGPNRPLGKFFRTVGVDVSSILNLRSAKKAFE